MYEYHYSVTNNILWSTSCDNIVTSVISPEMSTEPAIGERHAIQGLIELPAHPKAIFGKTKSLQGISSTGNSLPKHSQAIKLRAADSCTLPTIMRSKWYCTASSDVQLWGYNHSGILNSLILVICTYVFSKLHGIVPSVVEQTVGGLSKATMTRTM